MLYQKAWNMSVLGWSYATFPCNLAIDACIEKIQRVSESFGRWHLEMVLSNSPLCDTSNAMILIRCVVVRKSHFCPKVFSIFCKLIALFSNFNENIPSFSKVPCQLIDFWKTWNVWVKIGSFCNHLAKNGENFWQMCDFLKTMISGCLLDNRWIEQFQPKPVKIQAFWRQIARKIARLQA